MDVNRFFNQGGDYIKNPNYKKGNGQPKYITSVHAKPSNVSDVLTSTGDIPTVFNPDSESDRLSRGMLEHNLPLRREDYINNRFNNILAEEQSGFEQAKNSLIQTISEGTLGTVKAFADLFDIITLRELWSDSGYQNPVSAQIEEWQKNIRENIAPIYTDPDKNVFNGGLIDPGFIFSGLPSIITSLTLLIPSKAVSYGLAKTTSFVGNKGVKLMRNIEKAHRLNRIGEEAETISTSAKINAFVNGTRGQNIKNIMDYGVSGLTSRLLENYQEARQTHDDSKPVILSTLQGMKPEEKENIINNLKTKYGKDAADWNSDESIAELVAQEAATETFKDDMINAFSDIYQMYAIGKIGRVINGPSRAALNRLNRMNIKTIGMDEKAVDKILASRTRLQKFRDKASDLFFGAKHAITSELSEGVEEAVNYIAQEEGFHYGKVLLNQEAEGNFWSDRFIDYLKAPKLWDSAFWGLAGGIVFNLGAEYGNRFVNAIETIQKAKKDAKNQVSDPNNPIKVPTFMEAFADTELSLRKANLEQTRSEFDKTKKKLEDIGNGKDVFGITADGKLITEEEKKASKRRAIAEFHNDLLLDAMEAGNYDYIKEYLSSDELKQFFVDNNILSKEDADDIQKNILTQGDKLLDKYNKQLRLLYNAVSDWGENNEADLQDIPAEVFGIIARENIKTELENEYYQQQIDRLNDANRKLEEDSKDELENAAKNNGITVNDFKSIVQQIGRAQQLGMIEAQIRYLKDRKEHLDVSGQALLKQYEETKKTIIEDIIEHDANTGNDTVDMANLLISAQTMLGVELSSVEQGKQLQYVVNEGNERFRKLADAVQNRDRKLIKELAPFVSEILDLYPSESTDSDTFLNDVIRQANVKNEIIKKLHNNEGKVEALQNINAQLESNYREIGSLELIQLYNKTKINTTKKQIQHRASVILNDIYKGRQDLLDIASKTYQQLAKKYGKEHVRYELESTVNYGKHTELYDMFTEEERNAYDYVTTLAKFNRAEQDIVLSDMYDALEYNDIYEYSEDKDAVKIINEQIRKAKEKSTTSQNQNSEDQNAGSNDLSSTSEKQATENGNVLNGEEIQFDEDEETEGVIDVDNPIGNSSEDAAVSNQQPETDSSTGGQEEISISDIRTTIKGVIDTLEQSNPGGVTRDMLREQAINMYKPQLTNLSDEDTEALIDSVLDTLDRKYAKKGESIESKLAKNVIKLSTIASNTNDEKVIKEANAILDRTFSNLLDHFNKHLSQGKVNGKYVINLEALLRYAKNITNNEVDAQEMYNAFIKIISNHPNKYSVIKGRNLSETRLIEKVNSSLATAKDNLDKGISGRTLNIRGILASIDNDEFYKDEARKVKYTEEEKKELKDKIVNVVKSLKPGDKIYVRANYDKAKAKTKDPNGGFFTGGIDFVVLDSENKEVLIAKAPTPMYPADGTNNRFNAQLEGWFYTFPLGKEIGTKEYPIQRFFKDLFINNDADALAFRTLLSEYETLTGEEATSSEGDKLLDEAWTRLESFAKKAGYKLEDFVQRNKKGKTFNRERIRHLVSLDFYTQEKWALDVEETNYGTTGDIKEWSESYRESIDRWFNKMVESSNARAIIDNSTSKHGTTLIDINVQVESVGKPSLVRTKFDDLRPATQAIAEQHKDKIHLAAGSRADDLQLVVSNGKEMSLNGSNTRGRSVVIIDTPDGQREVINAYPVSVADKVFKDNDGLAAFKEAIETRLFELMDEWFHNANSENLQAFLDMLGHKSAETSKLGGSLFAGFFRSVLPQGNGFSIKYKVKKDDSGKDVIIPATSRENGEVHYLTFYDSTPLKHSKTGRTSKARASVQDYVEGRNTNKTVVWNTNPNDTSTLADLAQMRELIKKVLIDSLMVRIDPININADNSSTVNYGAFMDRDANGKLILKINNIRNPSKKLKEYAVKNEDGTYDIIINNISRDGKAGNFSDFIIFNDLVNLNTKPINGSNFIVFDNSDGDFGIQYTVGESRPVEKVHVEPIAEPLSKVVKDILVNHKENTNLSKVVIKSILDRIGDDYPSLSNLIKRGNIINKLLHKNVVFVEGFTRATYKQGDNTVSIPKEAYAAYMPADIELDIDGKKLKVKAGDIIVSDEFMQELDGNTTYILDALRRLLHENVHAFIADNDKANPELNNSYKKELNDLWDEYTRKRPTSVFSRNNSNLDLEEFIVESLTNADLIKDLNNLNADEPLNNPKHPKSLLGKLLDKLLNWLSDLLVGPNGEKFEINKDSLLSKEYAIFEETIMKTPQKKATKKSASKKVTKPEVKLKTRTYIEDTLNFDDNSIEQDEPIEVPIEDGIIGFEVTFNSESDTSEASTNNITIDNNDDDVPPPPVGIKNSTIGLKVPTLRGALDNVSAETYFDIQEKINNGVLSIKCN